MSKISAISSNAIKFLPLVLAVAALFIWASVAHAQTELQTYGSGGGQVVASGTSAGGGAPEASSAATSTNAVANGAGGGENASGTSEGASASESGGPSSGALGINVLPTTGGPLLPLLGLGAIALGATGLLARNRYIHR